MPDAVNAFVETGNIDAVRTVHRDLHALYREDITKYAPKELRLIIRDIYDLIPREISTPNRRFQLSSIKDVKRFDQVREHFLWLSQAGVALPVYNVQAPIAPLLINEQRNLFKLFYLDAGLLASTFPKSIYDGLLDGKGNGEYGRRVRGGRCPRVAGPQSSRAISTQRRSASSTSSWKSPTAACAPSR
ncbi:MAG: hypothetical protein V8Q09_11230 [Adlercreutzia sp.]